MNCEAGEVLMTRIAVVDHPSHRLESVSRQLENAGVDVMRFGHCELLLNYLPQMDPDIVVMSAVSEGDPKLCSDLAEQSGVPIVAILRQHDPPSALEMFDSGAADCMTEPVSGRELVARVNALLRRTRSTHPQAG